MKVSIITRLLQFTATIKAFIQMHTHAGQLLVVTGNPLPPAEIFNAYIIGGGEPGDEANLQQYRCDLYEAYKTNGI